MTPTGIVAAYCMLNATVYKCGAFVNINASISNSIEFSFKFVFGFLRFKTSIARTIETTLKYIAIRYNNSKKPGTNRTNCQKLIDFFEGRRTFIGVGDMDHIIWFTYRIIAAASIDIVTVMRAFKTFIRIFASFSANFTITRKAWTPEKCCN